MLSVEPELDVPCKRIFENKNSKNNYSVPGTKSVNFFTFSIAKVSNSKKSSTPSAILLRFDPQSPPDG